MTRRTIEKQFPTGKSFDGFVKTLAIHQEEHSHVANLKTWGSDGEKLSLGRRMTSVSSRFH